MVLEGTMTRAQHLKGRELMEEMDHSEYEHLHLSSPSYLSSPYPSSPHTFPLHSSVPRLSVHSTVALIILPHTHKYKQISKVAMSEEAPCSAKVMHAHIIINLRVQREREVYRYTERVHCRCKWLITHMRQN